MSALLRIAVVGALLGAGFSMAGRAEEPVVDVATSAAADAPAIRPPEAPQTAPAPVVLAELKQGIAQSNSGRLMGLVGCLTMVGLAVLLSTNRRAINWRLVAIGSGLQLLFALLVLKTGPGKWFFAASSAKINQLLDFSQAGSRFLFGNLADNKIPVGQQLIPSVDNPLLVSTTAWAQTGSMIAFRVLPTIIFFSALIAVLYHVGILQRVVQALAWVMQKTMGTSGAESLSTAANIFLGQTEAPLVVKPYIERMTQSELCCIMVGGFATVAGGVLAAYVGILQGSFPDIAGHLLAASVMAAPASLVMSKIMVPETEVPVTSGQQTRSADDGAPGTGADANLFDAAARGTSEGLMLALNVAAMLIGFLALLAMVNALIGGTFSLFHVENMTLQRLFGFVGAPFAFVLGTPWEDAVAVGQLMGTKTVVNEFVAYLDLSQMMASGAIHNGKSVVIAVYALCGFSNFGSIGIQIGGLAAIAPSRRADIARLGLRAMIAGSFASFQTAAIAAMVL